jgi:hypothetical protein
MLRRLLAPTLVLAGLAAARADAQAPGPALPIVNPAAPGFGAPSPVRPGVGTPDLVPAGDPHRWPNPYGDVYVDPRTGTVYIGTIADKWPLPGANASYFRRPDRFPLPLAGGAIDSRAPVLPQH